MINIITSSRYKINRSKIKQSIQELFANEQIGSQYTLNIVFVGKNKMKVFTQKYKGEKETLPVLSFVFNQEVGEEILLGEVILCYPLIILLAAERNKRVDEMINELVKHGVKNLLK